MSALRNALRDLPDAVFVDVLESNEEYLVVTDLPGTHAGTIDVSATGGRLRIEARREKDVPREFRYLQEDRALFLDGDLPLPPDASTEDASGSVEKGVLELRLPKRDRTAGSSIPIDGTEADTGDDADNGTGPDEAEKTNASGANGDAEGTDVESEESTNGSARS